MLIKKAFSWMFRNRETGEITFVQMPNIPLGLFFVASTIRWIFHPSGNAGIWLDIFATAGLVWWAILEIAQGVNPFRKMLGLVFLVMSTVRF